MKLTKDMHQSEENPAYPEAFVRLIKIVNELRQQCPWDKVQTIDSIRHLTIEEVFELSDAIMQNDLPEIRKELGDLLMHVVFYSRMASEMQAFDLADVLNGVCDKLISRHPHIYADTKVADEQEVKRNWEQLKLKEKGNKGTLSGVPSGLPPLLKALRIQEKARGVGFDWQDKSQVWLKVLEEQEELLCQVQNGDKESIEDEFGDLLFALVNYGRFLGINPENALERTNQKFIKRFNYIEQSAAKLGKLITAMDLEEMEKYWQEAKSLPKNS